MFIHLFFNSIFLKEKQALQNEVKRLEMEIKRNLQTQNDVSAGTKNQTPSGRVVMASKPPQSEKPVGNLKSSNQSPIPNATGMKMAAPKVSAKSAPIVNNAVGVQKTKNSPSTLGNNCRFHEKKKLFFNLIL